MNKTLVLGMGNSILTDDAIGLLAAKSVYDKIIGETNHGMEFDLVLTETGGMSLLDIIRGYDTLVVIDAIKTGQHTAGEVLEIDVESALGSHRMLSSHDLSLFEAVKMGRTLDIKMPAKILIYCIEILNNTDFSDKLSPEIDGKLPQITGEIAASLASHFEKVKCKI